MPTAVKTPQFSVKLGWNKELKRNDRVVVRVALHRIPTHHINVDVQKDRVKVDTLKNTRKFVLEAQYPAGVSIDENGASATEEYGYLIVQIPIQSPDSEAAPVPKQRQKQLEAEKQTQRESKKQRRRAEKAAEAARAAAIANMAGADPDAVKANNASRNTEKLKRRIREDTAEKKAEQRKPVHAWAEATENDVAEDVGDNVLNGSAEPHSEEDSATAMDETVESGQYEALRQQYELVKDELDDGERAELEQELRELYEMELDPTGRGVEGAVLDAPLTKKKQKKKKKKRKADSATETELMNALEIAEEVAATHDDEQAKVVDKEQAKRAWEEDQKAKQRDRKARKKEAKAALVQELRRNEQTARKLSEETRQSANDKDTTSVNADDEDVVTMNSRKKRRKSKQLEAGTGTEQQPQNKRKRRDEHERVVQDDDDDIDQSMSTKGESAQISTKKQKKRKKKEQQKQTHNDGDDAIVPDQSYSHDAEQGRAKKKSKKVKKEKKPKKEKNEAPRSVPQSPVETKPKRGSDGILKAPRSSGKQLKRVSFSPKPQTKSIPAVPYTRNKWLW